jgi:hypothetical protein
VEVSANLDHLYGTMSSRLDTIGSMTQDTIVFWQSVKRANDDYEQNADHGKHIPTALAFMQWMEDRWGIKLILLDSGNWSTDYKIITPDKYTMFVLKYSQ